jgi:hypothetical protein
MPLRTINKWRLATHITNVGTRWSREIQAPAALPAEKESRISIGENDVWVPDPEWLLWLRLSIPMLGIKQLFPHVPARNLATSLTELRLFWWIFMLSIRTCKRSIFVRLLHYNSLCIPQPVTLPVHRNFLHSFILRKQYFIRNVYGVHAQNWRKKAGRVRSGVQNAPSIPRSPLCLHLFLLEWTEISCVSGEEYFPCLWSI